MENGLRKSRRGIASLRHRSQETEVSTKGLHLGRFQQMYKHFKAQQTETDKITTDTATSGVYAKFSIMPCLSLSRSFLLNGSRPV